VNLGEARIAFRPRTLAETFDLALRWVPGVGGRLYLVVGLWFLLPAAIGCYLLQALADFSWTSVWLLAIALGMLLQGLYTVAASRLMFERDVTARSVASQFVRKLPSYLGALIVTRVITGLGVLTFFGIPWAWAYGAFVHEAVLLEGHDAMAAVRRAGAFTSRQYGNTILMGFGQLLALFAFVASADQVGSALLDFVLQVGRPFGALFDDGGSLGALLGFFAAIPFLTAVRFLMYIDGRTRRDGWDIQLAFLSVVMADERTRREVGT
jgi:hypothetical protein